MNCVDAASDELEVICKVDVIVPWVLQLGPSDGEGAEKYAVF
jgi:hypothetical protein